MKNVTLEVFKSTIEDKVECRATSYDDVGYPTYYISQDDVIIAKSVPVVNEKGLSTGECDYYIT